jgi:hypothetical protein
MSRLFKNPRNNKTEKIDIDTSVCVFFLGPVYLAYKGLWPHVLLWSFIALPIPYLFGTFAYYFTVPFAGMVYASTVQSVLIKRYIRFGWKDVTRKISTPYEILQAKLYVDSISSTFMNPVTVQPAPISRPCQYCSAVVAIDAVKCSHCHSDLFAEIASV